MENRQQLESQIPQWMTTWAKYLLNQSSAQLNLNEASLNLVEQILLAMTRGDSCLDHRQFKAEIVQNLAVDAKEASRQVAPFVFDQDNIYLYRYWQLEQRLAAQIQRLVSQKIAAIDLTAFNHLLEDPHQKAAMKMVAQHSFNVITGGPGTGKTYTLARIIAVLNQAMPNIRIAMAAPTGKAAQRMKEALQHSLADPKLNEMGLVTDQLKQQDTLTIHRLLGIGRHPQPRFHLKQPLAYDVIVVDEASMLDLHLATLLFEAIPNQSRLILLGDANQLASVDVGSVLADLREVEALQRNHVNLVTSRRFKAGARIGEMAQFIQKNHLENSTRSTILKDFEREVVAASTLESIALSPEMQDIVQLQYLPDQLTAAELLQHYRQLSLGFRDYVEALKGYIDSDYAESEVQQVVQAFDQYRILTAVRHGVFGLYRLNAEMQTILLEQIPQLTRQGDWYIGRPVMMTYNDYQLGLSNGDIGICFKHRSQPAQYEVFFPSLAKWVPATRLPKSIETAFALTIHKSQGSEFKHTAVVLDESATNLLSQELIYTAITRAKSVVSLLVHPTALAQSFLIKTTRSSGLVNKIKDLNLIL